MHDADITERAAAAHHDRRLMALYYAWGREDAGDRRLREASGSRVVALDFAEFAADQAAAFEGQRTHHLAAVQDQYDRYVTALTIGARHIQHNTGIEIEITAYDGTTNLVHAHTIPEPWPGNPHSHDFTCPPATLAGDGYRLAPAKPTATNTPQR